MATVENYSIVREKLDDYLRVLAENGLLVWRAYLFGSWASGTAGDASDIDLAVFLDREDIEGFEEEVRLLRLRWNVDLRIEPHAFARTDFDAQDPFVTEIIETGQRVL